jgi:predicted DNA-binding transcriptional regulator AlpA
MTTQSPSVRPCEDEWLSTAQFAKIVGKSVKSIYNEIDRGDDMPPFYKFKLKYRFPKSELDAWLAQFRRTTVTYERKRRERAGTAAVHT